MNTHRLSSLILTLIVPTLLSTGCAIPMLRASGDVNSLKTAPRIVVLETSISPPALPILPLIDAAAYKGGMNNNAEAIVTLHKNTISRFENALGGMLASKFGAKVAWGNDLYSSPQYQSLATNGVRTYPTSVKDGDYNGVIIPQGALNFFNYSGVPNLLNYFDAEGAQFDRQNIANIAKTLNADLLVVATAVPAVFSVSAFGIVGTRYMIIKAAVFDRTGKRIATSFSRTKNTEARPGDLEDYESHFAQIEMMTQKLVNVIFDPTVAEPPL